MVPNRVRLEKRDVPGPTSRSADRVGYYRLSNSRSRKSTSGCVCAGQTPILRATRHTGEVDRIYHLALPSDWAKAQRAGVYKTSTRGLLLHEVGFIHCSRGDQWQAVRTLVYADVDVLLLLTIDPALLDSPWRFDPVDGTEYPHIYGPLNLGAVTEVKPLVLGPQTR
jgi:uncharacterized protein (DUF952 family)